MNRVFFWQAIAINDILSNPQVYALPSAGTYMRTGQRVLWTLDYRYLLPVVDDVATVAGVVVMDALAGHGVLVACADEPAKAWASVV